MAKPVGILIALTVFISLVVTVIRGAQMPKCFYCGAAKVRPSRPAGLIDTIMTVFMVRPYRCSGCQTRFYAIRLFSKSREQLKAETIEIQ